MASSFSTIWSTREAPFPHFFSDIKNHLKSCSMIFPIFRTTFETQCVFVGEKSKEILYTTTEATVIDIFFLMCVDRLYCLLSVIEHCKTLTIKWVFARVQPQQDPGVPSGWMVSVSEREKKRDQTRVCSRVWQHFIFHCSFYTLS